MNKAIGKSTGIALLLAAALLAALFAMGVFSATGVGAHDETIGTTAAQAHAAQVDALAFYEGDTLTEVSSADPITIAVTDGTTSYSTGTIPKTATHVVLSITPESGTRISDVSGYDAFSALGDVDADPADPLDELPPATTQLFVLVPLVGDSAVGSVSFTLSDVFDETTTVGNEDDGSAQHADATYTVNFVYDSASNSESAGAAARLNLQATVVETATDTEIVISAPKFGVPTTIDEEEVTINGVEVSDVSADGSNITIVVPDMNATTAGDDPLPDGTAIIRISNNAGITNPTVAGLYPIGIDVKDLDDAEGNDSQNVVKVIREIKLSSKSGASGADITVTGTGFGGQSATVFIDNTPAVAATDDTDAVAKLYESNDAYDADDDVDLGTVDITDGKFTLVTDGITKPDVTPAPPSVDINAIDGNSALVEDGGAATYSFKAAISVDPETASWGETVTITLSDWTTGNVTDVRFGGTRDGKVMVTTPDDGEVEAVVPSGLRTGKLKVEVFVGSALQSASGTIEITPLDLTISPSSPVPGQQITITGSGYEGTTAIDSVTVGTMTYTSSQSNSPIADAETNSGGSATVTVNVPLEVGTGDKTVSLTVGERTGEGTITVPKPSITLNPTESLIGSTVQVTGTGFASNGRVLLDYGTVATSLQIGQAAADGSISMAFDVPSGAGIGDSATVEVYVIGTPSIDADAKHSTPDPVITTSGPVQAGGEITITGSNFKGFSTLSDLRVGGQESLPSPAPETDRDGNFETTVRVPLLGIGSHTVTVADGSGNRGTESFSVVAESVEPASTDPAEVFASLIEAGRLSRVWFLDAENQAWLFYDPDPEVATFNNLPEATAGEAYIIIITPGEQVEFQGRTLYEGTNNIALR